jgi:hypothetical protein
MTATLESDIDAPERMTEARQARLQRLRAFREQMERADREADAGSLERATDIAAEFAEKEWVKELPEVTKTHYRGQPIKADGLSRFAGWAKATIGYRPAHVYRLIRADEVRRIIFSSGESIPAGVGENSLRPLSKLLKDKRDSEIPQVWHRALQTAAVPTHKQVGNALRAHDTATGRTPTNKVAAYYQRTVQEEHKKGLRALVYIHDHGSEGALQAYINAIQAQLDKWEATPDGTQQG